MNWNFIEILRHPDASRSVFLPLHWYVSNIFRHLSFFLAGCKFIYCLLWFNIVHSTLCIMFWKVKIYVQIQTFIMLFIFGEMYIGILCVVYCSRHHYALFVCVSYLSFIWAIPTNTMFYEAHWKSLQSSNLNTEQDQQRWV